MSTILRLDRFALIRPIFTLTYTGPWIVLKVDDKSIFVQNGRKINKISIDRCRVAKMLNFENMQFNESNCDLFFSDEVENNQLEECRPPPIIPARN